jgi:hypothetical protein
METVTKEEITMAVEQVARGVHRLRRYFELERAERELAAIDYAHNAAARQMEVFAQQLDQEKPMPGRMPISLNAMVQSGKYMWAVAAVRREADLLVGVLCNNTFKEQSPYWNDPLILMMGHEASLDRWRDALDRLNAAKQAKAKRRKRGGAKRLFRRSIRKRIEPRQICRGIRLIREQRRKRKRRSTGRPIR